jgi:hypothetical protein
MALVKGKRVARVGEEISFGVGPDFVAETGPVIDAR